MAAARALPVRSKASLQQEVRDSQTGELFGRVNGDGALKQALREHGFRVVEAHQGKRVASKSAFAA